MRKRTVTARIEEDERDWLNQMARKVAAIEGRPVSAGEILKRVRRGEDIEERLIRGAELRRMRR